LSIRCLIVGEAYGAQEEEAGAPFVGASGIELNEELEDAGWLPDGTAKEINRHLYNAANGRESWSNAVALRDRIFREHGLVLTNVVNARPPGNKIEAWFLNVTDGRKSGLPPVHDLWPNTIIREGTRQLQDAVRASEPRLVLCLGATPLWAIGGRSGITKWRGSSLYSAPGFLPGDQQVAIACTLHPAAVLRDWPWRPVVVHDLKRALHETDYPTPEPEWQFTVRPALSDTLDYLADLCRGNGDAPLVSDIETTGGHITCIGFSDGPGRAICIPFLDPGSADGNYWRSARDEELVTFAIRRVLRGRRIVFHNGLYDMQVIQSDWGFSPNWTDDTMIAQHVAFPGMLGAGLDPITGKASKKGSSLALSFIASMYCAQYRYWKDDGRLWDPTITDAESYWRYNCEDCARTFECLTALLSILREAGLLDQYAFQCRELGPATLRMMRRGLRCDMELRSMQLRSTRTQLHDIERRLEYILGHPFNPQSAPQMRKLFYEDLCCPPQWNGRGEARTLSCDDEALAKMGMVRPFLQPLIQRISDYRTLSVLGGKATGSSKSILTCRLSEDNRLRTTLGLCGAETFRYASGPTAQGEGCNLQNILKVNE
jgi:uracil-DNA glycosylase